MTDIATLEELTRSVVKARTEHAAITRTVDGLRRDWEADNRYWLDIQSNARTELVRVESDLRVALADWWDASDKSTKKPLPGLGVRVGVAVAYDRAEVLAWAKRTGRCLALNEKAFELIAETHADDEVEALCTFGEKITPTLAADIPAPPSPRAVSAAERFQWRGSSGPLIGPPTAAAPVAKSRAVSAAEFAAIVGLPTEEHHELTPEVHRA